MVEVDWLHEALEAHCTEWEAVVYTLQKSGKTQVEIAGQFNVSQSAISQAYRRACVRVDIRADGGEPAAAPECHLSRRDIDLLIRGVIYDDESCVLWHLPTIAAMLRKAQHKPVRRKPWKRKKVQCDVGGEARGELPGSGAAGDCGA